MMNETQPPGPIPDQLLNNIKKGDCVLFLGADLRMDYDGAPLSHAELAQALAMKYNLPSNPRWPQVAAAYLGKFPNDRHGLVDFLNENVAGQMVKAGPLHEAIARVGFRAIVTAWYDEWLEQKLRESGYRVHRVVRDIQVPYSEQGSRDVTIVKLFGCVSDPDSLVLTERERIQLISRLGQKLTAIISFAALRPLIFVGYDLTDSILMALYEKASEGVVRHMRRAYAVWPQPTEGMRANWIGINLEFLNYAPTSFLKALAAQVPSIEPAQPHIRAHKPPYKFLDFFTETDADIFCGRDTESQLVFRLALSGRVLTLFGPSGAGKTSLLRAGVIPRLAQEGYVPLYLRAIDDPLQSLYNEIATRRGQNDTVEATSKNLREFLRDHLKPHDRMVIVFDQFEEFFLRVGSLNRELFFVQLASALKDAERDVRFIFSLREDHLARLDEARGYLPDVFVNSYRLRPLDRDNARVAITEPASRVGVVVEPTLVNVLVGHEGAENDVPGDLVEADGTVPPPALQIVMDRLYRASLPLNHPPDEPPPHGLALTLERYSELNGASAILAGYVDEGLDKLSNLQQDNGVPLGANRALGEAILKVMVTSQETKAALTQTELLEGLEAVGVLNPTDPADRDLLDRTRLGLERVRLLRSIQRAGLSLFELAHDHIATEIAKRFSAAEMEAKRARELLRRQVDNWQHARLPVPPDALDFIYDRRESLKRLNKHELELLLRSALAAGKGPEVWIDRMDSAWAVAVLAKSLVETEQARLPQIAKALGYTRAREAIPYLEQLIRSESDETQRSAVSALVQLGQSDHLLDVIDTLREAAQQEQISTRAEPIIGALQTLGGEESISVLKLLSFQHSSLQVRSRAANALLQLGYPQSISLIACQLRSDDAIIRQSAVGEVKTFLEGQPAALEVALQDADLQNRLDAVELLRAIGGEHAIARLLQALWDEDISVRQEAAKALGELKHNQAVEPLMTALNDNDSSVRREVVKALGQLGDKRAIDLLLTKLQDSDPSVRREAASALGRLGDRRAVGFLRGVLQDENSEVQHQAARALEQLGEMPTKGQTVISRENEETLGQALILLREGNYHLAFDLARKVYALAPDWKRAQETLAEAQFGDQLVGQASSYLETARLYLTMRNLDETERLMGELRAWNLRPLAEFPHGENLPSEVRNRLFSLPTEVDQSVQLLLREVQYIRAQHTYAQDARSRSEYSEVVTALEELTIHQPLTAEERQWLNEAREQVQTLDQAEALLSGTPDRAAINKARSLLEGKTSTRADQLHKKTEDSLNQLLEDEAVKKVVRHAEDVLETARQHIQSRKLDEAANLVRELQGWSGHPLVDLPEGKDLPREVGRRLFTLPTKVGEVALSLLEQEIPFIRKAREQTQDAQSRGDYAGVIASLEQLERRYSIIPEETHWLTEARQKLENLDQVKAVLSKRSHFDEVRQSLGLLSGDPSPQATQIRELIHRGLDAERIIAPLESAFKRPFDDLAPGYLADRLSHLLNDLRGLDESGWLALRNQASTWRTQLTESLDRFLLSQLDILRERCQEQHEFQNVSKTAERLASIVPTDLQADLAAWTSLREFVEAIRNRVQADADLKLLEDDWRARKLRSVDARKKANELNSHLPNHPDIPVDDLKDEIASFIRDLDKKPPKGTRSRTRWAIAGMITAMLIILGGGLLMIADGSNLLALISQVSPTPTASATNTLPPVATLTDTPTPTETSIPSPTPSPSPTTTPTATPTPMPTVTWTPTGPTLTRTRTNTPTPPSTGQILFTSSQPPLLYLYSVDVNTQQMTEIGRTDITNSTCNRGGIVGTTGLEGKKFTVYRSQMCGVVNRVSQCRSPNGQWQANYFRYGGSPQGSITVSLVQNPDPAIFIVQDEVNESAGISWAPDSRGFIFYIGGNFFLADPNGGYEGLGSGRIVTWSPDSSMLLIEEVNDISIYRLRDHTRHKLINGRVTGSVECPVWKGGP